jgi:hypothetical protein
MAAASGKVRQYVRLAELRSDGDAIIVCAQPLRFAAENAQKAVKSRDVTSCPRAATLVDHRRVRCTGQVIGAAALIQTSNKFRKSVNERF